MERLADIGRALHGEEWQRATARDLGAFHPRGPRTHLDDRHFRRWIAGDVAIPNWVEDALPKLVSLGIERHRIEIRRLEEAGHRLAASL